MWHRNSLKFRLLSLVLTVVAGVWITAAALTYLDAREELEEVLDAHLEQAASLMLAQVKHELEEHGAAAGIVMDMRKQSSKIAFQVLDQHGTLLMHSSNAPEAPMTDAESGYSTRVIGGIHWRIFSAPDDSGEFHIHMAERMDLREDLAHGIAVNLLKPLLITLPILAILLWYAIGSRLRPLVGIAHEVERREPDNLAALDASAAPDEVMPLIERLNALFGRIGSTLENERRFTADAAHELRTPIAAIKAQAQVARGATENTERTRALDGAIAGCDRATHLIEQLLTLARLENVATDKLQPSDLRALSAEVMAELAPAALNKDVRLELTDGATVVMNGLPALLTMMLRNLIDNAVRHTPAGTSVQVKVSSDTSGACLTVSDDGPGLPEEELEKISQRFYRPLGTTASGSGLGLSIVRRIAELHHATLSFSSNAEKSGLKVTVTFPLAVQ